MHANDSGAVGSRLQVSELRIRLISAVIRFSEKRRFFQSISADQFGARRRARGKLGPDEFSHFNHSSDRRQSADSEASLV